MSEKVRYDVDYPDSRIQKEQERAAWGVIDELEANPQPELNTNGGECSPNRMHDQRKVCPVGQLSGDSGRTRALHQYQDDA